MRETEFVAGKSHAKVKVSKEKEIKTMEYVKLGNTGLNVSKICLGCMGFGALDNGGIPGKTSEEEARKIIRFALDNGINFFDTANYYSRGISEEILGRAIRDYAERDDMVIATKLYYPMTDGKNAKGLSRKSIFREVDNSLKRLGTDYIDLYIIHRLDHDTPMEEIMEALNDLVRSGKVRYIGASSMYAWQFMKLNAIADKHGWAKFISMQDTYNVIYREEEREMVPMLMDQKIAMTPFSPLAHGVFNKPLDAERTDGIGKLQSDYVLEHDHVINERVRELAGKYGVSNSTLALAWVLNKPFITSPLIGASKTKYVEDALAAIDLKLTDEDMAYLEEPYVPHTLYGFR